MQVTSADILTGKAIELLKHLISIPSFSREENETAALIASFMEKEGIHVNRKGNNVWALNAAFSKDKPTILLNSHHDTVKPNVAYTRDPFEPAEVDDKIYGLGSNDAGGCIVSLLACFMHLNKQADLKYNLVFAASAEEEISGAGGIESLLPELPPIEFAIVGEPTEMELAIAERGLMVIDCISKGRAGHAAREEGENAVYEATRDIEWFRTYRFAKVSPLLGPVKMTVTVVETANKTHNIVPSECRFVVDIRVNELYNFEEILREIRANVQSGINPRSMRLKSSLISRDHPLVKAGLVIGRSCYGSPTTSDKALMPFPALKMGPGDSARSHMADEFIYTEEIMGGISGYIQILNKLL